MKLLLILPKSERGYWGKISRKGKAGFIRLNLPTIAAITPGEWDVEILDARAKPVDYNAKVDLVGITGFTADMPSAYEIADNFRAKGVKVIMGGVHVSAMPDEALEHADSVIIGEAELVWQKALEEAYEQVSSNSIDYAVSEKVEKMLLIPGDFGWNDIGDWNVVYQLGDKNADGNVVFKENDKGGLIVQDANNNLVHIHDKLIAAVGIKDLVIIDTKDVLLVMPRAMSQDVKKIVTALKEQNKKEYL